MRRHAKAHEERAVETRSCGGRERPQRSFPAAVRASAMLVGGGGEEEDALMVVKGGFFFFLFVVRWKVGYWRGSEEEIER